MSVTVPALKDPILRLKFYGLGAQIGYQCQCFRQAEALLDEAFESVQDIGENIMVSMGSVSSVMVINKINLGHFTQKD